MKTIAYSKSSARALARIPTIEARRIVRKIEQHVAAPSSPANKVEALAGSPYVGLRVGDWRVIMDDRGIVLDARRHRSAGQ
jgi:mRNA interferase RelE/StbE